MNPFELLPGESLGSHVDMLKAAFSAAFPMEAAMPYMLEDAIYGIYERYGWNLDDDEPVGAEVSPARWPVMDDLLEQLKEVVDREGFDTRLASDYKASLVSRLRNLTIGAKGRMLNCRKSIDFMELLDKKVIFEMDDLKDQRDKSFLMALILARVSEAVKIRFMQAGMEESRMFAHITLVEEAHRLLERVEPGRDDAKALAVNAFGDMLAEVRKYREGLIIVDQIPNKLASEVIKNTNTKIIHKLLAKDDREVVGDAMALDDDQKAWLSRLKTGEAVVLSGDWLKAVHCRINRRGGTGVAGERELHQRLVEASVGWRLERQTVFFPEIEMGGGGLRLENYDEFSAYRHLRREFISFKCSSGKPVGCAEDVAAKLLSENWSGKYPFLKGKCRETARALLFFLYMYRRGAGVLEIEQDAELREKGECFLAAVLDGNEKAVQEVVSQKENVMLRLIKNLFTSRERR
jgi:hypothetical protein